MKSILARGFVIVLGSTGLFLAVHHTFFDQDLMGAKVCLSSAFVMYFLHRNPELLSVTNWKEFGDTFDSSRDKKYIWGFPLYQLLILAVGIYIWIT